MNDDQTTTDQPAEPVEPVDILDKHPDDFTIGLRAAMADHGNPVQIRIGVLVDVDGAQPCAYFTLADSSVCRVVFKPERTMQLAGNKSRAIARIIRDSFAEHGIPVTTVSPHPLPRHLRRQKGNRHDRRR